jgi:hypothetical protein
MANPGPFFEKDLGDSKMGFVGSFSVYLPYKPHKLFHFDFGLQNRLTTSSAQEPGGTNNALMMFTPNIAVRAEFWRIFVGGGFSPLPYSNKPSGSFGTLRPMPKTTSYFIETGLIWRVIPEFQIVLVGAVEIASVNGTAAPNPSTEYGLRFRFPLNPNDYSGKTGVKFDGFRYPFGVMK